jgi:hypothetical protein
VASGIFATSGDPDSIPSPNPRPNTAPSASRLAP